VTAVPHDAPGDDPLEVFARWHHEATATSPDPDAAALATATSGGRPSVRFVLLRGIDAQGVRFFTNYDSRKGAELASNPRAAIAWFDSVARRQVRIEGAVSVLDAAASDAYFASRDRGHQLGAHASHQSAPLADRASLQRAYAAAESRFDGSEVPRPDRWGGYLVVPDAIELWVQRPDRLHDRFSYSLEAGAWSAVRLAP
jgi:pyridoxamine 5'-phosphate oxidase